MKALLTLLLLCCATYVGLAADSAPAPTLVALQAFIAHDPFAFDANGSIQPRKAPTYLYAFVKESYATSPAVRHAMASYFLAYDRVLLRHGRIDTACQPDSLIWLMWNNERVESSSTGQMRDHIARSRTWFSLTPGDLRAIAANELLLIKWVDFATRKTTTFPPPE